MEVIICLDDNNGMLFARRRQSRDRAVTDDICRDTQGTLYITEFSKQLFTQSNIQLCISDDILDTAGENDRCFIENLRLSPYTDKINRITVYRWNRKYPSDVKLDIDPVQCGFTSLGTTEFPGSSHEKITKEIFVK